ncbi:hypothetical protein HRI_002121600 [Hibiscus trionum]|uniref:DCD domain-containing protein n=1 Tax=Hibiscus trionum TaxID=183268 RepID=A0A9W7HW45_HIBTR|nr:hypothetical protein HRI_002121600 [Hibiscus trionum]
MEQENNKNEADTTAVDLANSESSEKKSSNLSKAKSDIAKSVAKNFLKTRKANSTSEVQRKKQKKSSSISEGSKANENNVMKLNSMEENQQKDATTSMEHVEKSREIQKNKENTSASDCKEKITKSNDSPNKQRSGKEPGLSIKNMKNEEEQKSNNRRQRNKQKEKHSISVKNNTSGEKQDGKGKKQELKKNEEEQESNKRRKLNEQKGKHSISVKNKTSGEKQDGKGKKQELKKNEKIDGLIFMCNAKTKPDCFRYHVMGVSAGKKDLVLGIRPGVKLFLYDYDLKLLYGIYKASSSGGMKLEPKAFGGAFPAQVRFSVHADCFPLAENIFKKAIKENYDAKNKFKTELTARQVRKLTELFRPVPIQSTALPFHPPSRAAAHIIELPEKREFHDRPREARPPSHREASLRDPYANISARSYAPHEKDRRVAHGELASTKREDGHRDLYLSEKEYRTYGLLGERRNLTPQRHMTPTLTSYLGDHREPPLRQPDTLYREPVPLQRDTIRSDPLYLTEREYRAYDLGARREMQPPVSAAPANTSAAGGSILDSYITDPYHSRYSGDALVDAYLPRPRESHLVGTDLLRMRESNQADRLYSAHPSDALVGPIQMHRHRDVNPASASTSVSSRYSFGGASLSYR